MYGSNQSKDMFKDYNPDFDYNDPRVKIACGSDTKKREYKLENYKGIYVPVLIGGLGAIFFGGNLTPILPIVGMIVVFGTSIPYLHLSNKYHNASTKMFDAQMEIIKEQIDNTWNNTLTPTTSLTPSMSKQSRTKNTNIKIDKSASATLTEEAEKKYEGINVDSAFENLNNDLKNTKRKKGNIKEFKDVILNNFELAEIPVKTRTNKEKRKQIK